SRYLIRIGSTGISNWDEPDESKFQKILPNLPKCFDLGESEHSVYEVEDPAEEALVAAAHCLTNPGKSLEAQSAIRIRLADLPHFGIHVNEELGTTGVCWVDHRHRNLVASGEKITKLLQWIAIEAHRNLGQDRVRRILKLVLMHAFRRIAAHPQK